MRKSRFSEEQIIGILKEHQAGIGAKELCRKHGISDGTFYKWRSKYGGMEVSEAKWLKALEAFPAFCRIAIRCGEASQDRPFAAVANPKQEQANILWTKLPFAAIARSVPQQQEVLRERRVVTFYR